VKRGSLNHNSFAEKESKAMNAPGVVEADHHFGAPPERVFDAWLDPKTAGKWLFATDLSQVF
jgi:uncharacterized protein YndB with AHSA1/START domain